MATVLDELLTIYKFQQKGAEQVEGRVDKIGRAFGAAGRAATTLGTLATGALAGIVKVMGSHETELATFAAKTGQSIEEVRAKYGQAVEDIGIRRAVPFADVTRGFEKAYSGGVRAAEELIHVVDKAAMFHEAKLGDIAENLSTATTLANVFGITTSEALDVIAASATRGEGDSQEYAAAWKNAASVAKSVGIEHTELGAILVTASQEMRSVTKAGNSFIQFLTLLLRPTERAVKALADFKDVNLDIESVQKRVRGGDFKGVYEDLQRLIESNPQMLGQILESTEAMQQFLAVPAGKMIEEEEALIQEIPGAVERAFEAGANTIERQLKRLLNEFKSFVLDLGATMRPTIDEMIATAKDLLREFQALSPEVKTLVGELVLWGPAILAIGAALQFGSFMLAPFGKAIGFIFGASGAIALFSKGTIGTAIGVFFLDLVKWLGIVGRAVLTLGGVLNPIVAGILLVVGAMVLFRDELKALSEWFRDKFGIGELDEERGATPDDALPSWMPSWMTGEPAAEAVGEPGALSPTAETPSPREITEGMDMLTAALQDRRSPLAPESPSLQQATEALDELTQLLSAQVPAVPSVVDVPPAVIAATGIEVPAAAAAPTVGGPVTRTTNVTVERVEVTTQATDAAGIARDFRTELEVELQQTAEDYDSAVEG